MPTFMLLLHDKAGAFDKLSPQQMQEVVQKYVAWGKSLRTRKLLVGGHKLTDDPGRILRARGNKPVATDGPYAESRELLGGYFLVKARNYAGAEALAEDSPHLSYGGTIEIRQVDAR